MVDTCISCLIGREKVVIDVDSTDDKTCGQQQGALFNGLYDHTIYNQLFFHDGETGQIILPVLRPSNVHTSKWAVKLWRRIISAIQKAHPQINEHTNKHEENPSLESSKRKYLDQKV